MSRLKFVSMTRDSYPSMPSTERTNEYFFIACGNAYHAYLYFPYTTNRGYLPLVPYYNVRVRVSKYDVNYGIIMNLP